MNTRNSHTKLFALFLSIAMLSSCINDDKEDWEGANIQVGDKLPEFSVKMNDGRTITHETVIGKVSVILLFTTTCPDCQKQFPIIEQLYSSFKDNPEVIMIGISRAEGESIVGKFWDEKGYKFPYSSQEDRTVYSLFASSGVPRIFISDKEGVVQKLTNDNPIATYEELADKINSLINNYNMTARFDDAGI